MTNPYKKRKHYEPKPLFLERMQQLLSDKKDYESYMKILRKEPQKSLRCNTLKISPEKLKSRLEKNGWKITQPFKQNPEVMIVEGKSNPSSKNKIDSVNNKKIPEQSEAESDAIGGNRRNSNLIPLSPGELGRSLEHQLGYYYIQELASMLPIIALNLKPNERFLDLASAPGSKTTQAAAKMENKGTIIANEISYGRIKILGSNLNKNGVSNTIITKKEGTALCKKLKAQEFEFDKILVDTPCSGEGTIRGTPKTLKMWNINTVKQLSNMQKNLLESALEILKPNGELVYSTCTHSPEENEEILDFIIKKFKGKIKIEKITLPIECREGITKWQDKEYLEDVKLSCRIYPQDNNTEGFFIAKIKKIKWTTIN